MKKILFIFVLFFISINNVAANQCSGETKACVVCVYETNTFNVTYVVKSDGTSGAKGIPLLIRQTNFCYSTSNLCIMVASQYGC